MIQLKTNYWRIQNTIKITFIQGRFSPALKNLHIITSIRSASNKCKVICHSAKKSLSIMNIHNEEQLLFLLACCMQMMCAAATRNLNHYCDYILAHEMFSQPASHAYIWPCFFFKINQNGRVLLFILSTVEIVQYTKYITYPFKTFKLT